MQIFQIHNHLLKETFLPYILYMIIGGDNVIIVTSKRPKNINLE